MSKRSKLMTPFGAAQLAQRQGKDGYHHWLSCSFLDPQWVHKIINDVDSCMELMVKGDIPQINNLQALKWIDKHLEEVGVDYRDMEQIATKTNIFNSMSKLMLLIRTVMNPATKPSPSEKDQLLAMGRLTATMWWHMYGTWKNGGRVFKVCSGIADKLFLTDIKGLEWDSVRLPFPHFVLQVPPHLVQLEAERTGWHKMDTAFVSEGRSPGGRRVLSVFFLGQENEHSETAGDDASYYVNIFEERGDLIDVAIDASLNGNQGVSTQKLDNLMRTGPDEVGESAIHRALKFVFNVLIYVNSTGDVERMPWPQKWHKLKEKEKRLTGKKRKNTQARLRELERTFVRPYMIGRAIPVDPRWKRAATGVAATRRSPSVASFVRGHWKQQPHGPGRELRKLIWLEPHWRNLDAKKPKETRYKVS